MGLITSPKVGVLRLANGSRKLIGGSKELVEELNREDPSSIKVALEATRTLSGTVDTIQVLTATYREWLETVLQPTVKSLDKSELSAEQLEKVFKKVQKIPVSAIKKPAKALEVASGSFVDVAEGLSPLIDAVEKQVELTLSQLSIIEKQLSFGAKTLLLFEASLRTTIILRDSLERDISFAEATRQHLRVFIEDFIVEEGDELEFDNGDIDALKEVELAEEEVLLDLPTAIAESFTELREGFDDRYKARTEAILKAQETLQGITDNVNALGPGFNEVVSAAEGLQEFLDSIGVIETIGDFTDIVAGLSDLSDILELIVDAVEPVLDAPLVSDLSDLIDEAINSVPGVAELEKQIKAGIESLITELADAIADQLGDLPAGLLVPQIAILQAIIDAFELLDELVREIARPIGQSDDETGADDTIDFTAIAVSTSGNDTIALELDTEFDDDGLGGFALGRGGDKTVIGTLRPDLVLTQDGDDKITTKDGDDVIISGKGDDTISAGKGNDDVVAGDGVDRVSGDDGDDQLYGASGDDSLFGGAGSDLIDGGSDNDYLEAGEEADPDTVASDTLRGGDGEDTLVATAGDNVLDGGDGLDEIRTLGAVDATHLILDSSIYLIGGAGRDVVELEDDYALGSVILDGVVLDAGANFDTIKAGSLDLNALDAIDPLTGLERIQNFETLHITALAGETKTLITDVDSLNNFQTLILETEGVEFTLDGDDGRDLTPEEFGAIIIEVTGGDFVMSGFDANFPLIIKNGDMADLVNPHDGPDVDGVFPFFNSFVHSSKLNALTIRAAGDLATSGAVLTGNQATSDGFTFEGGAGADTITGGGGSDVIRAGLGADIINGGVGDSGNKFSNDSAVGDVIIGTLADFDGDTIFNLTNRVDRIRIEGSQDYFIETIPVLGPDDEVLSTTVNVYGSSQLDIDENEVGAGEILSTFTIGGNNPKLTFRGGSYIPLGASEAVDYVELFNNNVPPVAVSDLVETRNLGDGDLDGTLFNPFENDFDPDADVITNDDGSITRRQINEPASVLALLRQLSEADPNMPAVEVGARFETELGNKIFYTQVEIDGVLVDQLFYEARDPSVTLRMIEAGDAVGGFPTDVYDPTEALPFFGFDRIVYTNIDDEDETSDFAAINFIVRPDRVTDANGDMVLPSVEIFGVLDGQIIEQAEVQLNELAPNTSATVLDDQLTSGNTSPNAFLDTTFQTSDYLDIDAAGAYFGFAGGDVIDARDATGRVALFGGDGADWVEGGAGDDFLSGGGVNDIYLTPQTRTEGSKLPADVGPGYNVLLGGEGDNVFSASLGQLIPGFNNKTEGRDTVYVLDGGAETILGPMNNVAHDVGDDLTFFPFIPFDYSATTALALDGDKVFGFDNDDQLVLPTNVGGLFFDQRELGSLSATSNFGSATVNVDATLTGPKANSIVLLSADEDTDRLLPELVTTFTNLREVDTATVTNLNILPPNVFTVLGTHDFDLPDNYEIPEFVTYDLDIQPSSDKSTLVTAILDGFGFDVDLQIIDTTPFVISQTETEIAIGVVETVTEFGFETNYEVTTGPRLESYLDTRNLFGGGPVEFSIEFEGKYNPDRFAVELVPLETNGNFVDIDAPVGEARTTNGVEYLFYDIAEYEATTPQALGIAIVYNSFPPDAFDDQISVERGQAVTFNVFDDNGNGADSDADNDTLQIFDLVFEDKLLEAALLDGDDSNGELILEVDLNTGLGTGAITFVADEAFYENADSAFGEVNFGYIATDQEFNSELATVTIDVTGRRPELGDDRIILAADTDGLISIDQLLANDSDPDFIEGVGEEFDLSSIVFSVSGDEALKGDITPDGTGYQLRDEVLAELRARDTGEFGGPTDYTRFIYRLEDIATGASSEFAFVEVAIAEELQFQSPFASPPGASDPLVVKEDETISVDLVQGRVGGFGDIEINLAPDAKAIDVVSGQEVGDLIVSGDDVIFTPFADVSGVTAQFTATARDQLGQTVDLTVQVAVDPVDDAPIIVLLDPSRDVILTDEDTSADGGFLIFDPDSVSDDPALLDAIRTDPLSVDPSILNSIFDDALLPAGSGEIITELGGVFSFTATDIDGLFDFDYTPGLDTTDRDGVAISFEAATGLDDITIPIEITAVNDAPDFANGPEISLGTIDLGQPNAFFLLADVLDVDSDVDFDSLLIEMAPDPALVTLSQLGGGDISLTGLRSGEGQFTYSVADTDGLRSEERAVSFEVNTPPDAVNDFITLDALSNSILIDAIANDSDAEGAVRYVLNADGVPEATDPRDVLLDGDGPKLSGTVTWSDADEAFLYERPTDPAESGLTDQFFYDVVDDDGSTSRALVSIDLLSGDPNVQTFRFAASPTEPIQSNVGAELFVLGDGSAGVKGTLASLDGDEIVNLSSSDPILITDAQVDDITLSTTRVRGPAAALSDISRTDPTPDQVLGDTPPDDLRDAFVGDTILTVTIGNQSSDITLNGAFLGEFSATQTADGVQITYAPTLTGAGPLEGGEQDDDIRGDGVLIGNGGDDVLIGGVTNDQLFGGAGRDVLIGGGGEDTLTGGEGADLFLVSEPAAFNRIADFNPFEGDRIAILLGDYIDEDSDDLSLLKSRFSVIDDGDAFILAGAPDGVDIRDRVSFTLPGTLSTANSGPIAVDDMLSITLGETGVLNLLSNDTDIDGDPLIVVTVADQYVDESTAITLPSGALLTVSADGRATYSHAADLSDLVPAGAVFTDTFEYVITDGVSGVSKAQVSVLVEAPEPPVVVEPPVVEEPPVNVEPPDVAEPPVVVEPPIAAEPPAVLPVDGARLRGSDQADRLLTAGGDDTVLALLGDDTVATKAGDDVLRLGAGDDIASSGKGADTIFGGQGQDTIRGNRGADSIEGGGGNDEIRGGRGSDTLDGGVGDDLLLGHRGSDRLSGGVGNDTVKGGIGRDELFGGSGNDKLIGGLGSDTLLGGEGDDTLRGSQGADTLEGGTGSDRFVFGSTDGRDTISDFEADLDLIQITGGPADFSDLSISNVDGGVLVGFAETRVLVDGVEANDLNASQFLFV